MNKNMAIALLAIILIVNGMVMLFQNNLIVDLKTKLYIFLKIKYVLSNRKRLISFFSLFLNNFKRSFKRLFILNAKVIFKKRKESSDTQRKKSLKFIHRTNRNITT